MLSDKTRKYLFIIYIVVIVTLGLYVRNVLARKDVKIIEEPKQEKIDEVTQTNVTLHVQNKSSTVSFETTTTNNETLKDLLMIARDKNFIYYELTEFIDKTEIEVFSVKSVEIEKENTAGWNLYYLSDPATNTYSKILNNDIANYKLKDKDIFLLKRN